MTSPAEWAAIEAEAKSDPAALSRMQGPRPGFSDRRRHRRRLGDRSSTPTRPGAARSGCAPSASQEDQGRGTWNLVVTEIPYQVQKAKLIEKIAELLVARKLPLLDDVRDESAEDIRVVLVPKSRTVDPGLLMELLFKLTELETRFPLNMNVLSRGKVPNVLSLKDVLREWLDHRKDVLVRRSTPSAGRDRAAAGDPRRLPDRLSQHRRGDPDHPRGGRAEAGDDGPLVAHRQPGRGHPQHAAARAAQAGGDRDPQGVRRAVEGEGSRSSRCLPRTRSSGRRSPGRSATSARSSGPTRRIGQAPHRSSPMRPTMTSPTSTTR